MTRVIAEKKYTHYFCMLLMFILLSCSNNLFAQSSVLHIHTSVNDKIVSVKKNTKNSSQILAGNISWNIQNDSISIQLDSASQSNPLYLKDFDFNLNSIDDVESIKCNIFGYSKGNGNIQDSKIFLSDGNNYISLNQANRNYKGNRWPNIIDEWTYYFNLDEGNFEILKGNKLQLLLQIENTTARPIEAVIYNVEIVIKYKPRFKVCKDEVVTFFVDEPGIGYTYIWSLPDNTALVSGEPNSSIINVLFQSELYNEKTIAVDITKESEIFSGQRIINYNDCRFSDISGEFWIDKNCNAILDSIDLGLDSLKLSLYENELLLMDDITNINGIFNFDSLISSTYDIRFELNNKYLIPSKNGEYLYGITYENNKYRTNYLELTPGSSFDSLSYGVIESSSLTGSIWEDINGNNLPDLHETIYFPTHPIILVHDSGNELHSVSDSNGLFIFDNIAPGKYDLCPNIEEFTYISGNAEEQACKSIVINCGEESKVLDIGLIKSGEVSGRIWLDNNENGIRELTEELISNTEIKLLDTFDNIIETVYNDSLGFYSFNNIKIGTYYLAFEMPNHFILTDFQVGSNNVNNDFKKDGSKAKSSILEFVSNSIHTDIDCGLILKKSSIGDLVWLDLNENGLQDNGEEGLNEIEIELYGENDMKLLTIQSQISDANESGFYKFDNITSGNYYIKSIIPDLYKFTTINQLDQSRNSNINDETGTSEIFELIPGEYLEDIDIGLVYNYGEIESMVWSDSNQNGILDDGESGIKDIILSLYTEGGVFVETKVSLGNNSECIVKFDRVVPGKYYLKLDELPTEFILSQFQFGNNDNLDSDFNIDSRQSITFDVLPGSSMKNIDLGLRQNYSSIEGVIWNDINQDGIKETHEVRIDGIEVELYDENLEIVGSTISGSIGEKGKYRFEKLIEGKYFIKFYIGQDYLLSMGTGSDTHITGTFGEGTTELINIAWGDSILDIDGGLIIKKGSIGDFVWYDKNENGLQDNSESGLSGINVELIDIDGITNQITTTDENGKYLFQNVYPKEYYLKFENNGIFEFSPAVLNNDLGSKVIEIDNGYTSIFNLLPDEDKNDMDAGLIYKYSNVGNDVWIDSNSNGIFDNSEDGLGGVTIKLYNYKDSLIGETISDLEGKYNLLNIPKGQYYITVGVPTTLKPPVNTGSIYHLTNQNGHNSTDLFNLVPGDNIIDADFGLRYKKGKLGDLVWFDENENGKQDLGENGINGIYITLFDLNGHPITEIQTKRTYGIDGYYEFKLEPGNYYLEFGLQDKYDPSFITFGFDRYLGSDITNTFGIGTTDLIKINSGQNRTDIDAGLLFKKSAVTGKVWFDENDDGEYEYTELGLNDIKVKLFTKSGELIDSTVSSSINGVKGIYRFDNLTPREYYLSFENKQGYIPTFFNAENDDLDSDITGVNGEGTTDIFNLAPGEIKSNIFGGFVLAPKNFIGDFVWLDENLNGLQDTGEDGIDNIEVKLFDSDSIFVKATVTRFNTKNGKHGFYNFTNIPEGDYFIQFVIPIGYLFTIQNSGSDESLDNDVISVYGSTDIIEVKSDSKIADLDAGLKYDRNSGLGDFVWEDMNGNGLQDDGEQGINDVLIKLFKEGKGFIRSTKSTTNIKTGEKGFYLFDNLSSGRYFIKIDLPDNYYLTNPSVNQESEINSDINDENGFLTSSYYTLGVNDRQYNVDVGLYQLGGVGNLVWKDLNKNGIQNDFEEGINNVLLTIHKEEVDNVLLNTTTDHNGNYSFNNLPPGQYYLKAHSFNKDLFTIANEGGSLNDSDVTHKFGVGTTSLFQILSGVERNDIDFGIIDNIELELNTYPNPVNDVMVLTYFGNKSGTAQVKIYDREGNAFLESSFESFEGENTKVVNIKHLKFGFYNVVLFIDGKITDNNIFLKVDSK